MDSGLQTLKEDKSWEDGTWSNLGNGGKTVKQDGKDYSTFKYSCAIPKLGKT